MRSERVQQNMLYVQNVQNTYRKQAFQTLLSGASAFESLATFAEAGGNAALPADLRAALAAFREPIDFSLEAGVPAPRDFAETLTTMVDANRRFITQPSDEALIASVIEAVQNDTLDAVDQQLSAEMTAEREEEREAQQEEEKEREIEIEKYVDLAYDRDGEAPEPWPFTSLADSPDQAALDLSSHTAGEAGEAGEVETVRYDKREGKWVQASAGSYALYKKLGQWQGVHDLSLVTPANVAADGEDDDSPIPLADELSTKALAGRERFYPASYFKLYKRSPVQLPQHGGLWLEGVGKSPCHPAVPPCRCPNTPPPASPPPCQPTNPTTNLPPQSSAPATTSTGGGPARVASRTSS